MAVCEERCFDEVLTMVSRWTVSGTLGSGGTIAKTTNIPGTGFYSVSRTAAGKYTVTFALGTPLGPLVDLEVRPWRATTVDAVVPKVVTGSYVAEVGTTKGYVKFEVSEIDETDALVDFSDTDQFVVKATFLKSKPAS